MRFNSICTCYLFYRCCIFLWQWGYQTANVMQLHDSFLCQMAIKLCGVLTWAINKPPRYRYLLRTISENTYCGKKYQETKQNNTALFVWILLCHFCAIIYCLLSFSNLWFHDMQLFSSVNSEWVIYFCISTQQVTKPISNVNYAFL